jgi:hypothetical protein
MGRTYPLSLAVFFTVRSLTSPVKLKFDRLQYIDKSLNLWRFLVL